VLVDTRLRDTAIRFEQIETDFIRLRDFVLNDLETLPEHWLAVAPSLYDALRNDIVHRYDTRRIRVDGRDIELAITWGSGRHLTFANGQLVLAVPDLAAGLRRAFDAYEAALRADGALRRPLSAAPPSWPHPQRRQPDGARMTRPSRSASHGLNRTR
jgi:hypothetical protein